MHTQAFGWVEQRVSLCTCCCFQLQPCWLLRVSSNILALWILYKNPEKSGTFSCSNNNTLCCLQSCLISMF